MFLIEHDWIWPLFGSMLNSGVIGTLTWSSYKSMGVCKPKILPVQPLFPSKLVFPMISNNIENIPSGNLTYSNYKKHHV